MNMHERCVFCGGSCCLRNGKKAFLVADDQQIHEDAAALAGTCQTECAS